MSGIIEKYLTKIRDATRRVGIYACRGQEHAQWPLHSAATRRLVKERGDGILQAPGFPGLYTKYHLEELIEPARARGFDVERGHKISDLQLLAKLQHFGAATGLLDFTWSPLVALWFASQDPTCDGKLFIVNTSDPIRMSKVLSNEGNQDAKTIFSRGDDSQLLSADLSYWEPMLSGDAMSRILRQRSVFIIGRPQIPEDTEIVREIEIAKEDKASLLEDLALLDISQPSLFQDIYGFAEANRATAPLRQIQDPDHYLLQGNQFYQEHDYSKAIDAYSTSIELAPDVGLAYLLRGSARAASGDYERALEDYSRAVDRKGSIPDSTLFVVYYNRANTYVNLNKFEEAIADYDEAISLKPDWAGVFNNRGNSKDALGRHDQAIADYNEAIRLNPDYAEAYLNRGLAKAELQQYDEAIADLDHAIHLKPDWAEAYRNRGAARGALERYADAITDFDLTIRLSPDYAEAYSLRGLAKDALRRHDEAIADYDKAISLNQDLTDAYLYRGITKATLDLKDEAKKDFETALELAQNAADEGLVAHVKQLLRVLNDDESP